MERVTGVLIILSVGALLLKFGHCLDKGREERNKQLDEDERPKMRCPECKERILMVEEKEGIDE